jgi:hypothetical protein
VGSALAGGLLAVMTGGAGARHHPGMVEVRR